jgi:hypothetical protein
MNKNKIVPLVNRSRIDDGSGTIPRSVSVRLTRPVVTKLMPYAKGSELNMGSPAASKGTKLRASTSVENKYASPDVKSSSSDQPN